MGKYPLPPPPPSAITTALLDEPEHEAGTPEAPETDPSRTRRDEQRQLRRHKHRWRRRLLITLGATVGLVAVLGTGAYFYARYRFDQIKKVHAKHLVAQPPGKPFDILLVGSDSRSFVENATQIKAFGSAQSQGGQRSDVTIIARVVPAQKEVWLLSIPRDLWVHIPGNVSGVSGMNRINSAFNNGPDLLVQTIEANLGIPINHYVSVNFDGFQNMVNALGGISMNFSTPVKDNYSGLRVTQTGCQAVPGTTALELVRARHLYYEQRGSYQYDGLSDLSRIQRQDAFFRALLKKLNASITNPFAVNAFIGAAVHDLTIDDTLGEGEMLSLAREFHGIGQDGLHTETLPTYSFTTAGGAAVLGEAQPYDNEIISQFNALGTTPPAAPTSTTTTTTSPSLAPSTVRVQVLNGTGGAHLATTTGQALRSIGYDVVYAGDAAQFTYTTSEIEYGAGGEAAAQTLAHSVLGGTELVANPNLVGNNVTLIVGSDFTGVTSSGTSSSPPTTAPTTTTIPGNIYTNTQQEPWNPVPC